VKGEGEWKKDKGGDWWVKGEGEWRREKGDG